MRTRGPNMAMQNSLGGARAPEWVHLIPAGKFHGRDGRGPWELKDAAAFIRATAARHAGAHIPLDYEHQSVLAEENGQPAPAAGWITELQSRPDGIWGRVAWTARGAAYVAAREYRYISPVFVHDKGGVLEKLESAALVAQPNLQLKALNNQQRQGASMDEFLKQLATLLGLAETASQEEIFSAVQNLKDGGGQTANSDDPAGGEAENLDQAKDALLEAVADLVGAAEEASASAAGLAQNSKKAPAPGAANRAASSPAGPAVAPATAGNGPGGIASSGSLVMEMGKRLATVEGELARNRAEKAVGAAMSAGKISPALKGWALNYAAQDPEGFGAFIKTAPVIVSGGVAGGGAARGKASLSDEERAVCKQLSIPEADYLKSRGQMEASHEAA